MSNDRTPSRRQFLAASSTATALGLAGCQALEDELADGPTENQTDGNDSDDDGPATPSTDVSIGETYEGEIVPDGPRDPARDDLANEVTFDASAGQAVTLTMASSAFDPHVVLVGPDGTVVAETVDDEGEVTFVAPTDGVFAAWATSEDGDATGAFTLTVAEAASDEADLRAIALGESAQGEIDDADPTHGASGKLGEPVTLTVGDVHSVTVTMTSEELDTYLLVSTLDGEVVAENDDMSDGSYNSQVTESLEAGTYRVWATTYEGDVTGTYTLSTDAITESETDLREIEIGETAQGVIEEDDEEDPFLGKLGEPVTVTGDGGQGVRIAMTSSDVDTYLLLEGPDGDVVDENDDRNDGSYNSEIVLELPGSGEYTIWATTYEGDVTGRYTLAVEAVTADRPDLREIGFGETASGYVDVLDETDPQTGKLAEPVTFTGSTGQGVSISMTSDELDTLLVLTGPNGEGIARNDDRDENTYDSEIRTQLPADGEYTIWATNYEGDATGPYTLSLSEVDIDRADLRQIELGETAEGYVDVGDETDPIQGKLGEPVSFTGSADQAIRLSMTSDDLDTYLLVTGPDGELVAENDDASDDTYDSEVLTTLPSDGTYTFWATTYEGDATGPYTLSITTLA
jgi:hypothetical protein